MMSVFVQLIPVCNMTRLGRLGMHDINGTKAELQFSYIYVKKNYAG